MPQPCLSKADHIWGVLTGLCTGWFSEVERYERPGLGLRSSDGRPLGPQRGHEATGAAPRVSVRNPTYSWPSRGLSPVSFAGGSLLGWRGLKLVSRCTEIIHSHSCCFTSFSFIREWINLLTQCQALFCALGILQRIRHRPPSWGLQFTVVVSGEKISRQREQPVRRP